ncbi:MAG: hypothetical protein V4582_18040 [Pseudomonadota bacterium]
MARIALTVFDPAGLSIDFGSWQSIVNAELNNNFTACLDLTTKTIYFGPLAPSPSAAENHYLTVPPSRTCMVAGLPIRPIVHSNVGHMTSHEQLAAHVLGKLGLANTDGNRERFCGFALRFEVASEVLGNRIALTGTSGTLNPGENRQLEEVIMAPLLVYLTAELRKIRREPLERVAPRTSPLAVATAIGGAGVAGMRMAMLSQLKKSATARP